MNAEGRPIDEGIALLRLILLKHDMGTHRIEGVGVTCEVDQDAKGQVNTTTLVITARPRPKP